MEDTNDASIWLLITREAGESIRIGDDVEVRVERVWNGKVWLAIEAPSRMPVHRGEVAEAIRQVLREEEG